MQLPYYTLVIMTNEATLTTFDQRLGIAGIPAMIITIQIHDVKAIAVPDQSQCPLTSLLNPRYCILLNVHPYQQWIEQAQCPHSQLSILEKLLSMGWNPPRHLYTCTCLATCSAGEASYLLAASLYNKFNGENIYVHTLGKSIYLDSQGYGSQQVPRSYHQFTLVPTIFGKASW